MKEPFQVNQRLVNQIIARAQNSAMGLGEPVKGPHSYDLSKYVNPDFESLANLLVSAHVEKYDLVSLMAAALEIVAAEVASINPNARHHEFEIKNRP